MKKVMYPIFAIAIITQSDSVLGSIKHVPPDSSALIGRMWTKETPPPIPGAISGNFASAPMAAVFDTVVGEEAGLDIFVFRCEKSKLEHRVTVEISSFLE